MMRPTQKSGRSRGKSNRGGKSQGHSPNRVYESAGPEGKVRGTPQQIIEKYQALARDAHLSGDRVGAENFLQHSEHYSRILVAAQEMAQERQGQQNGHNNGGNGGQHNGGNAQNGGGPYSQNDSQNNPNEPQNGHSGGQNAQSGRRDEQPDTPRGPTRQASDGPASSKSDDDQPPADGLAAIEAAQGQPDLVETPEGKPKPRAPRTRRPRTPKVVADDAPSDGPEAPADAPE